MVTCVKNYITMHINRRNFVKMLPLGALLPSQFLSNFTTTLDATNQALKDIEKVYEEAIVFDGIVITRGWNQASFDALAKSGYTGFNASLGGSGNLRSALKALLEWRRRIKKNPDKLIYATSAEDFIQAKKEGRVAVMLGFQNANMLENSIDNLDILYQSGARWIQLTYNQRNFLGDGCTERTNAGLSDFGVAAVERMNDLGIVIDLSHCGRQTTNDGIKFLSLIHI